MKRVLFSLLFLLVASAIDAQKIRFTDTSNKWAVLSSYTYVSGGQIFVDYGLYECRFTGYAQQDSLVYSIYRAGFVDSALIREDTLGGKIYAKVYHHSQYNDTAEFVLFDYNLQVGDTFITMNTQRYVQDIDSVLINGVWHRVYSMAGVNGEQWYKFVEGIGCLNEPLLPGFNYMFEYYMRLVCFEHNGVRPLVDPMVDNFDNDNSCDDIALSISLQQASKNVSIYPQPAHDNVQIMLPAAIQRGSIRIYDYTGKTIYNKPLHQAKEIQIDNETGLQGIYFYNICDQTGAVVYKGKLQFL